MAIPKESSAEMMSAYLDAELDPTQVEQFEDFLDESPEAQRELADLRQVMSLVAGLPSIEAPDDFYEKLSRKIRRRQAFDSDGLMLTLISLPFQVLSIIVILAVAAVYMMAELSETPQAVERAEPADTPAPIESSPPQSP